MLPVWKTQKHLDSGSGVCGVLCMCVHVMLCYLWSKFAEKVTTKRSDWLVPAHTDSHSSQLPQLPVLAQLGPLLPGHVRHGHPVLARRVGRLQPECPRVVFNLKMINVFHEKQIISKKQTRHLSIDNIFIRCNFILKIKCFIFSTEKTKLE